MAEKKLILTESTSNRPVVKSLDGEIAGWIQEDKNGTQYLSLRISNPLGEDHRITMYPTDEEGNTQYQQ